MKAVVEGCLRDIARTENGFVGRFRFPGDLEIFAGHFPGRPLVPGIFLIEAARCAAERVLETPLRMERIKDAKFTAEVGPDQDVFVEGTFGDAGAVQAEVRAGDAVAATLKLVCVPDAT